MNLPGTSLALQCRAHRAAKGLGPSQVQNRHTLAQVRASVTPLEIAECLKESLSAVYETKRGPVPNWNTRLQAVQILLNYFEGRPIDRQEVVTMQAAEDDEAVLTRLMRSPAARAQLRRLLDAAECS